MLPAAFNVVINLFVIASLVLTPWPLRPYPARADHASLPANGAAAPPPMVTAATTPTLTPTTPLTSTATLTPTLPSTPTATLTPTVAVTPTLPVTPALTPPAGVTLSPTLTLTPTATPNLTITLSPTGSPQPTTESSPTPPGPVTQTVASTPGVAASDAISGPLFLPLIVKESGLSGQALTYLPLITKNSQGGTILRLETGVVTTISSAGYTRVALQQSYRSMVVVGTVAADPALGPLLVRVVTHLAPIYPDIRHI